MSSPGVVEWSPPIMRKKPERISFFIDFVSGTDATPRHDSGGGNYVQVISPSQTELRNQSIHQVINRRPTVPT